MLMLEKKTMVVKLIFEKSELKKLKRVKKSKSKSELKKSKSY